MGVINLRPTPVLYLDLDGTVRHGPTELGRFVNAPEDVKIFDGVVELLLHYKQSGYLITAVSNQGGVALGHLSLAQAQAVMNQTQILCQNLFDAMSLCPHHPDAKDPADANCLCRKPRYGQIVANQFRLNERFPKTYYPNHLALMVGDLEEDRLCAEAAGIRFKWAHEWRTESVSLTGRKLSAVQ